MVALIVTMFQFSQKLRLLNQAFLFITQIYYLLVHGLKRLIWVQLSDHFADWTLHLTRLLRIQLYILFPQIVSAVKNSKHHSILTLYWSLLCSSVPPEEVSNYYGELLSSRRHSLAFWFR